MWRLYILFQFLCLKDTSHVFELLVVCGGSGCDGWYLFYWQVPYFTSAGANLATLPFFAATTTSNIVHKDNVTLLFLL